MTLLERISLWCFVMAWSAFLACCVDGMFNTGFPWIVWAIALVVAIVGVGAGLMRDLVTP